MSVFSDHRSAPLAVDRATLSPRRSGPRNKQRHFHAVKVSLEPTDEVSQKPSLHRTPLPLQVHLRNPQLAKLRQSASLLIVGRCKSTGKFNRLLWRRIWRIERLPVKDGAYDFLHSFVFVNTTSISDLCGHKHPVWRFNLDSHSLLHNHNNITTMLCPVNGGF